MPRGQPDYGMYAPKKVTGSLSDMGELAVRLGSIVSYDKRGDVVDLDDFEAPILRWKVQYLPIGGGSYFSSLTSRSGIQSYYMYTDASALAVTNVQKYYQLLGVKRLGVEISFCKLLSAGSLEINIWYYDGTNRYKAIARIDANTKKLYVYDSALALVEVADIYAMIDEYFANQTIKLVVDFDTEKYARLLYLNREFDISTISLNAFGVVVIPSFFVKIEAISLGPAGTATWLDDFILTQNEP